MIAKIGHGKSLYGALAYNLRKVEKREAQALLGHKMLESPDGKYPLSRLLHSFEPYLLANRKTEKPVLHISLNPDPKDELTDDQYKLIAEVYMQEMGYGDQPFVIFKHSDTGRNHIHIVSVCVDQQGKKIPDAFEKRRSMKVCRELERRFGLVPTVEKNRLENKAVFRPVDHKAGDLKSQVAAVVRYLPAYYRFQSLGEYNALLSMYNISAEKIEGTLHGKPQKGLVYAVLDENGRKSSLPFKASLFGKAAGYPALEQHFIQSKESLANSTFKATVAATIATVLKSTANELDFKEQLATHGINTIIRRNDAGRLYGITFIDHHSQTVWNGSCLGKEFSANAFHEWWAAGKTPNSLDNEDTTPNLDAISTNLDVKPPNLYEPFDFMDRQELHFIDGEQIFIYGRILPDAPEQIDQNQFSINSSKKKKKRRKSR